MNKEVLEEAFRILDKMPLKLGRIVYGPSPLFLGSFHYGEQEIRFYIWEDEKNILSVNYVGDNTKWIYVEEDKNRDLYELLIGIISSGKKKIDNNEKLLIMLYNRTLYDIMEKYIQYSKTS